MSDPVYFSLSALDQAMLRVYMRYCLCYPCDNSPAAREAVAARLKAAVNHAMAEMPILAGEIAAIHTTEEQRQGRLEALVTLDQLNNFQPIIKALGHEEFPHTYESLRAKNMPPELLMGDALTPLPDNPANKEGDPIVAVQGSFIDGGFLVAIYIHHTVADIQAIAEIIKHMSKANAVSSPKKLTKQELEQAASQYSKECEPLAELPRTLPDRSDRPQWQPDPAQNKIADATSGKEPEDGACRTFAFSLDKITSLKEAVNKREDCAAAISAFTCLSAILWKGITKARYPQGGEDRAAILLVPVSIRKKLGQTLDESYYGNASMPTLTGLPVSTLKSPYEESSIKEVAETIVTKFTSVGEPQIRAVIAAISATPDVRVLSNPNVDLTDGKLVVSSWENIPTGEEASLSLGLGELQYARMISREHANYYCIVLPRNKEQGLWEVQVQLPRDVMTNLLADSELMQFVKWRSE